MAAPAATFIGVNSESRHSPRVSELWKIVGGAGNSVDGDTCAIIARNMKRPQIVIGNVSYAISGQTVTAKLMEGLAASEVIVVEVVGLPV